jgi:hypothetical protein
MKKFIYLFLIAVLCMNFSYAQNKVKSDNLISPKKGVSKLSGKTLTSPVNLTNAFNSGANYLRMSQADITEDNAGNGNPDFDNQTGGWYWVATYPAIYNNGAPTYNNLYGVSALGLYYNYFRTGSPTAFTALSDAVNGIMALSGDETSYNIYLLVKYSELPGITDPKYKNKAKVIFDACLSNHGGTATSFAQYIRDNRGPSYHNGIIPWDIAGYVLAAKALDAAFPSGGYLNMAKEMAEVLYQDSYNNNPGYFKPTGGQNDGWDPTLKNSNYWWYTLGISGLMDAFYEADIHTDKLPELKTIILNCQFISGDSRGAFSGSYGAHETDDDWQSTAYSVMTLARINQGTNQAYINSACYYLQKHKTNQVPGFTVTIPIIRKWAVNV